jgi:hypothetical protein
MVQGVLEANQPLMPKTNGFLEEPIHCHEHLAVVELIQLLTNEYLLLFVTF